MCAWEAATKELLHKALYAAVNQKEGGEGGGKEYFNCYRRIEETLAKHSLKAA